MGTAGRPHLCAASGCPVGRPAPATRWAGRGCAPGVRPRPASGRQGRVVTACEGREEGTPSSPPLCPAPLQPLPPPCSPLTRGHYSTLLWFWGPRVSPSWTPITTLIFSKATRSLKFSWAFDGPPEDTSQPRWRRGVARSLRTTLPRLPVATCLRSARAT